MSSLAPASRDRSTRSRHPIVSCCIVAALASPFPACVALFDVPPGRMYEIGPDGQQRDACTDHYGAVVADVILGTLALVGAGAGFNFGQFAEGFNVVGAIGIGGAIGHYVSAASSDATRCRALLEAP